MPFKSASGFTLIELVIGIVVLSLSFGVITTLILPASMQSVEQVHQIRAAELGQSLLNEILGRAFDENSDRDGGRVRCGEPGRDCSTAMGPDGVGAAKETRELFDDVDDYHGSDIEDALGATLGDLYKGFVVEIIVCYDRDYSGECDGVSTEKDLAKLIKISVTTPQNNLIQFATYKVNF